MSRNRVLIVDDEPAIRFGIRDFLEANGFEVEEAANCASAVQKLRSWQPDLAVIDYLMPDGNALELLPKLLEMDETLRVVVLTAHASIDLAVRAVKVGAEHFLTKPVELSALLAILNRVLENQRNKQKTLAARTGDARSAVDPFLGRSPAIQQLHQEALRVVKSESPILLQGPTGAGKGVLARWLHDHSSRNEEAFVDLNCAGLSTDFLESELFGHEKGAFTGATSRKLGLFEVAHRGTLFLDEIGDVDPRVQPKLLKVLEEKRFRRMGDVQDRHVDVRLIAATHQDLAALVQEKRFRSDLYFRISAIPLRLPSLQERSEDIPALASRLLTSICAETGRSEPTLTERALASLRAYSWPGNVRELRNVMERAVLMGSGPALDAKDFRFEPRPAPLSDGDDTHLTLLDLERKHIERVLREENGRVADAAKRLGIPRSSLYQKVKKHGIGVSKV